MSEHVKNVLIFQFNEETQTLDSYDVFTDGDRQIVSTVSLEQLFQFGEDEAFKQVGQAVLCRLKTPQDFLMRFRLETSLNKPLDTK